MAITDAIKTDLLLKKLYGVAKTDTAANKSPGNEATASPSLNRGDLIWTQAASIPTTAAAVSGIVQAYQTTARIECTSDTSTNKISGTVYPTWKTELTNWIPPEFDTANVTNTYRVKVFFGATGVSDPSSTGGTQISADGTASTGEWYFDYQAGTLNFIGGTIPTGMTGTSVIYVYGYRYVGSVGVTQLPNLTVASSLTVNSRDVLSSLDIVSAAVANEISARAATSAALQSAINTVSAAAAAGAGVDTVSIFNAISVVSAGVDRVSNALSNEISNRASAVNVVSNALSVETANRISADNAVSIAAQSAVNTVSAAVNTVSNALSAEIVNRTSADNAASVAAQSAINTVSAAVNVVSNALSAEILNRVSAANVLSGRIDTVSAVAASGGGGGISFALALKIASLRL